MLRLSNGLIGLLNVLGILISLPIIAVGILFGLNSATDCEKFFHLPFFFFGIFLLVVSFIGMLGACCRSTLFLRVYLLVTFALVLGLLAFTVLAFIVTRGGAGRTGVDGGRLADYSGWLRKWVSKDKNWAKVRSCLKDAMVCGGFGGSRPLDPAHFFKQHFSAVQSGCCKPPTHCGRHNATTSISKSAGLAAAVGDCSRWSNDQGLLCYNCAACKAGVMGGLGVQWKKLAIFNIALVVFLAVVFTLSCCALQNNRSDRYQHHKGYYNYHR